MLLEAVESQCIAERWASVQCLAVAGVCSATVISELLGQLLGGHERRRRERAADLLA